MTLYLSGFAGKEAQANHDLGFLLTPQMGNLPANLSNRPWGADTGCFTLGDSFKMGKYIQWLERMQPYQRSCLFATAPDVVEDPRATWEKSAPWFPAIRSMGWRVALVAQDGLENIPLAWDAFDALFIGGSTKWKTSEEAEWLVRKAKQHRKHVHMGRVNSWTRLWRAAEMGCDSVDGTFLTFAPTKNSPRVKLWMERLQQSHSLWQQNFIPQKQKEPEQLPYILSEAEDYLSDLVYRLMESQQQLPLLEQRGYVETFSEVMALRDSLSGWVEHLNTDDRLDLAS